MAGNKINPQKSVTFLSISDKEAEKESGEQPIHPCLRNIWINLTKEVKDTYRENFKTLKSILEDGKIPGLMG